MDNSQLMQQAMPPKPSVGGMGGGMMKGLEESMPADGTISLTKEQIPMEVKEGDIIQMEVIMSDENGVIVKPVEQVAAPVAAAPKATAGGLKEAFDKSTEQAV